MQKEKQNNKILYLLTVFFILIDVVIWLISSNTSPVENNVITSLSKDTFLILVDVVLGSGIFFIVGTIWLLVNLVKEKARRLPLIVMVVGAGVFAVVFGSMVILSRL